MRTTWVVFRRELASYFATPVAYVFIVIFLFVTGVFTFQLGQFFERALDAARELRNGQCFRLNRFHCHCFRRAEKAGASARG